MTNNNEKGKYDDLCEAAFLQSGSRDGVLLLVVGGDKGSGFSVTGTAEFVGRVPELLETVAKDIRAQRQGAH